MKTIDITKSGALDIHPTKAGEVQNRKGVHLPSVDVFVTDKWVMARAEVIVQANTVGPELDDGAFYPPRPGRSTKI